MTTITKLDQRTTTLEDNRKMLAAFLRTRRESLDPQRLGLPRSGRRRTPGLRREEVALLADVGVTWYTWLEQGRDVNPSVSVMTAITSALQCSPVETRHLFILAGLSPAEIPAAALCENLSPASRRLLDALMPNPASMQKPNFDLIGYNRNFCLLMGVDLDAVPVDERNCIYQYLTNDNWSRRLGDKEYILPLFVGYFRAGMAEHRGEPRWEALLECFFSVSAEFKALWQQRYEVRAIENHRKQFIHPQIGTIQMQQTNWYSAPRDGARLLVYLPVDEEGERQLEHLSRFC